MESPNTKQKEKISVNHVEGIVIDDLASTWQTFDPQNDHAIDGIIFLAKRGHQTGKMIYAQVKTGKSYLAHEAATHLILKFSTKHLTSWKKIWRSKDEPVILIYVKSKSEIYWTNVKDVSIYVGKTQIKLSKTSAFGAKAKSPLVKLCRTGISDKNLPIVSCLKQHRPYLYHREELKLAAKKYYNCLKLPGAIKFKNSHLDDIKFSRLGWNHITNRKRSSVRVRQSLELLGVVKLILENIRNYYTLKVNHAGNSINEFIGLKAKVNFQERATGVVQIVIVRRKQFRADGSYEEKKWFLSVHEIKKD